MTVLERLREADIKKYAGRWVAIKDGEVMHAAETPREVADWLRAHDVAADLVYRVPAEGEPKHCFF